MKKIAYLGLLFTVLSFLGCSRVPSGSIGIVTEFDGAVRRTPAIQGIEFIVFDSMSIVDVTETRVPLKGLQPKDSDNVRLASVSSVITYKVNVDKAIDFYLQTKELDEVDGANVLGFDIIKTEGITAITSAFLTTTSQNAISKRDELNEKIKTELQSKLDARYPQVFEIVNVNTPDVVADPTIENIIQQQAAVANDKKLLGLKEELIQKQNNNLKMEMEGIKIAAQAMGVSSDKLLDYKARMDYNNALRALAEKSTGTQVQVKGE